jgi:hypothetical protein
MASQTHASLASISGAKALARTQTASTKLTVKEFGKLESVAIGQGSSPGEWIREVLLREVERASGFESSQMILTEIVGLQLFLTNVLAPIARGEKISAEQYQELMRQVKINKHKATQEVLAQKVTERTE